MTTNEVLVAYSCAVQTVIIHSLTGSLRDSVIISSTLHLVRIIAVSVLLSICPRLHAAVVYAVSLHILFIAILCVRSSATRTAALTSCPSRRAGRSNSAAAEDWTRQRNRDVDRINPMMMMLNVHRGVSVMRGGAPGGGRCRRTTRQSVITDAARWRCRCSMPQISRSTWCSLITDDI